ncbi:D-methionine transport system substrate-binding protein [Glaciihabitans tibetensis]|uniref:D-methionine transport system substrate-binding protein n=1 Tax=Glaciihabitans tibetensis TaxID=1266600 RepID=A0A2T0VAT5_9MICO|nr:MetQ/NlpA family ABC transporter substrate-binding protein [Glaciihabitans tibetensis]PRY67315.1 D-methionine transport system substrate-binding protein [Glaciihabitans tibetensis]
MSSPTPLIAPPKKRGRLYAIIAAAVVVVIAAIIAIVALNNANDSNASSTGDGGGAAGSDAITEGLGSADEPVKIGVVGASDPYWADYVDAAEAEGIAVDLVDFTDYAQPNPALTAGDLDLNQFQHLIYLAQYNENAGEDVTPIGATAIYPLGLYSTQYTALEDIEAGETVAVPNDASNLARALLVLQSSGLVELADGGSPFSTLDDVLDSSKVEVIALEAALVPTSLPDVAAAIINNDFVDDAGLSFDDALATDDPADPSAQPYINVFASRAEDADNEVLLRLVDIFQTTPAVTDGLLEVSGGTAVLTTTPVDELQATLSDVQADVAAG